MMLDWKGNTWDFIYTMSVFQDSSIRAHFDDDRQERN